MLYDTQLINVRHIPSIWYLFANPLKISSDTKGCNVICCRSLDEKTALWSSSMPSILGASLFTSQHQIFALLKPLGNCSPRLLSCSLRHFEGFIVKLLSFGVCRKSKETKDTKQKQQKNISQIQHRLHGNVSTSPEVTRRRQRGTRHP